ncbi:MAG: O-antigen ligase family protein [Clostridia bacterium]|nr:O-antigen ligase family protein [Clostridia bacterium]
MKEKITKAISLFNKFIQSDWYIAFNGLLLFIGWAAKIWVPMLCIAAVFALLPLFFDRKTKHLLCLLSSFTFVISSSRHKLDDYAPLLVLVILLLVAMVFSLVRYKRDFKVLHPTRIKGFHVALIALIVPFALGGVGSPYEHPLAVLAAFALVLVMAVGYTFLYVTNYDDEEKGKLPEYMLKVLFVSGIVIALEMVVYFAKMDSFDMLVDAIKNKSVNMGWAGANNVAPVLAMSIPASLYFCIKKSKLTPVYVLVALAEFALVLTTGCRGAILFTTIALPAMLFYVMAKTENKIAFGVTVSVAFAAAVVLVGLFGEELSKLITTVLSKGLNNNGRFPLFKEAFEAFKKWPVFGAGWDYRLGEMANDSYTPYWYHCTIVQIMANMGLVGLITFAAFYFWRYRSMLVLRKNTAVLALLFAVGIFDASGMVDVNFFGPTFFVILLCASLAVDLNLPENKCRAFGGRNPFVDIANLCKSAVTFVKTKLSKNSGNTSMSALESENIGSTTDSEMSIENAELKSTEQQEATAQEEN